MMFLRLLIFVASLFSLSSATESFNIESCLPGNFSQVISVEAGQSSFSIVTPQFAGDCEATVISLAEPAFQPIAFKYNSTACTTRRRIAFVPIPYFVPNGDATVYWQCQNTTLCDISLSFYGGYDGVYIDTNNGGERQGEQSCISDLQFSPVEAMPPWILWTDKKRSIRTNVAQRFPLNNITAPTPILGATASSALWATSSDFKWPVGTSSSGVFFSNTTRQTPSSSRGTTALNQLGANIENATSATHATATATHRTAISIHPTISRAKPPGKSSDPALSDSISTRVVPLLDITAFAILTTIIQAMIV